MLFELHTKVDRAWNSSKIVKVAKNFATEAIGVRTVGREVEHARIGRHANVVGVHYVKATPTRRCISIRQ